MVPQQMPHQSELFTVRLWPEDIGEGRIEWRGKVQHAISGETRYFREWPALVAFFSEVLTTEETITNIGGET